jgi:hypothetical protein
MHVWDSWNDACNWCDKHASGNCSVLARSWFDNATARTARLKYCVYARAFFAHGAHKG